MNQPNQPSPQTNWTFLLTIFLVASLIGLAVFAYQYWQIRQELQSQTQQVENLLEQIAQLEEQIEDLEIAEPADETADWQTYQNEEYGFEVRYPSTEWSVEDTSKEYFEIYICSSEWRKEGGACLLISIRDISLDNFIKERNSLDPPFGNIFKQENYTLSGKEGVKLTAGTALGIDTNFIFVEKNNRSYIIKYADYDSIHNQILSTFKFINHE